uniref:3-keto-disaccharide hydrolase n=1 Tax=uncultured Draconibacterium sp. TaxID=1573823 RepID=UPI003216AC33
MKRLYVFIFCSLFMTHIFAQRENVSANEQNKLTRTEKKEGWKLLFDGKTFKGWRGINLKTMPDRGWVTENGEIVNNASDGAESGNGGDIITKKQYASFELRWEWKMITEGGNSGVKYFVKEGLSQNSKYGVGLEYQILDDENHSWMLSGKMKPNDFHTLGSVYEIFPATNKTPNPLKNWNHSRLVCKGMHVEHWLNGIKVLEYERGSDEFRTKVKESKFKKFENFGEAEQGHILLQDHGNKVHFRNIKIRKLKDVN